MGQEIR